MTIDLLFARGPDIEDDTANRLDPGFRSAINAPLGRSDSVGLQTQQLRIFDAGSRPKKCVLEK
jgi:hypothetical protein